MLESLGRVAEGHATDTIVEPAGGPADQCGSPCRLHRFEGAARAEGHVWAAIDTEHDAALALLAKHLQVRLIGARRDLPIHVTDVVALAVLPHFLEVDTSAPEHRGVESGKGGIDQV